VPTLRVTLWPEAIVDEAGCVVITGSGAHVTVIVAEALDTLPQLFDTFTQRYVVMVGVSVMLAPVPPATGDAVSPELPTYH